MGSNDAVERRPTVQEGELIDAKEELVAPQPPPAIRPTVIDFLDNRWRFAESNDANARRALLLLTGILLVAGLTLILVLALLVLAGLVIRHAHPALLALVPLLTGTTVAVTIYRRQG